MDEPVYNKPEETVTLAEHNKAIVSLERQLAELQANLDGANKYIKRLEQEVVLQNTSAMHNDRQCRLYMQLTEALQKEADFWCKYLNTLRKNAP